MTHTPSTLLNIYRTIEVDVAAVLEAEHDLSLSEYLILNYIVSEQDTLIPNIKSYMNYPISKLTIRIKKLCNKGLITKERRDIDERIVTILPTDAGKQLVKEVEALPVWQALI